MGLRLGPIRVFSVGNPKFINVLFKPPLAISSSTMQPIVLRKLLGMPGCILPLYYEDDSGPPRKPIPSSHVRPENRIRISIPEQPTAIWPVIKGSG